MKKKWITRPWRWPAWKESFWWLRACMWSWEREFAALQKEAYMVRSTSSRVVAMDFLFFAIAGWNMKKTKKNSGFGNGMDEAKQCCLFVCLFVCFKRKEEKGGGDIIQQHNMLSSLGMRCTWFIHSFVCQREKTKLFPFPSFLSFFPCCRAVREKLKVALCNVLQFPPVFIYYGLLFAPPPF